MTDRIETSRVVEAPAADIFALLCEPQGHVAIDATGMLQDADGDRVRAAGDTFVVHMDRAPLGDLGDYTYDVMVTIADYEQDALISWTILGQVRPGMGHVYGYRLEPTSTSSASTLVTSFYDWSAISDEWRTAGIFPVVSETALRGTLGILDRTVRRGYAHG